MRSSPAHRCDGFGHVGGGRAAYVVPSLADQFSKNHDEQLTYDNPPTSKNSDGFSL